MSENEKAAERLLSGCAWDDFCESIRQAGHSIERWGDVPDELDRAEWYRFMSRLLRNGLERYLENCEPERPRLRETPWRQSINFQHPEQEHLLAEFIDGSHDYRITGNRGSVQYFVIATWRSPHPADFAARDWAPAGVEGLQQFDPATLQTTHFLSSDAITFDSEGNFEIVVSTEPRPDNWLGMTEDCVGLLVRSVYARQEVEVMPTMSIERMDHPTARPIKAAEVAAGLAKAAQTVRGYAELTRAWWQENLGLRPNRLRFSMKTYLSNGGVPDRHHGFGTWSVPSDRALVIEFTPIEAESWIFQLCNIWQENLDSYEDGQGYVTKGRCRFEHDGSVRIVIAERDPGIGGNWIDTFGHRQGGMSLRFIKTAQRPPNLTIYEVGLEQLEQAPEQCLTPENSIQSGEVTD